MAGIILDIDGSFYHVTIRNTILPIEVIDLNAFTPDRNSQ